MIVVASTFFKMAIVTGHQTRQSEKMTNFLRIDLRIISSAKLRATSSAVKMLALSVIRNILQTSPRSTAAAPTRLFILDPSV